jgi:hypothetical protein
MHSHCRLAACALFLALVSEAKAGLYYSGEQVADLPSQWRGFLLDQRTLRNIAVSPSKAASASPARLKYQEAAARLEKSARDRKLSADEAADLGALYVRLGDSGKAVQLLRNAQREHPNSFRVVANLGTAWQLQGDLEQAATWLTQTVRLAPGKVLKPEEYHLKLVRLRQRQGRDAQELDDLFGIRYAADSGKYEPGKLGAEQRKKLPADAAAIVQQLALWLPADGRLLWQLEELANAHGDVKTAAAIMDGCVNEFGMHAPDLRRHRQAARAVADELGRNADVLGAAKAAHGGHAGTLTPRSRRPLVNPLDQAALPPINADGVNALPWAVLAATTLDRKYKPAFSKYLQELDGKQIMLSGFMQPLGEDPDLPSFMLIEYPVGCWYCEMPEMTGIVFVELPKGTTTSFTRGLVKIEGTLHLNATDPENFLYTIGKARVREAD